MKAEDIVLLDNEPTLVAFTSEEDIIAGSGWDKGKLVVDVANFGGKLAQQVADGVNPTDAVNKQQLDLKADKTQLPDLTPYETKTDHSADITRLEGLINANVLTAEKLMSFLEAGDNIEITLDNGKVKIGAKW